MLEIVNSHINKNNLANSGTPILVACSGGIDSMVLIDILLKLDYKIGVAHCNFQLRDEESDGDELFVKNFCEQKRIPFFIKRFETTQYKKDEKVSVQMAARQLRYDWFETLRKENNYHSIATAHHSDDQLETILLNFAKGTGIKGLSGMKYKNGFVIRPLRCVSKQMIIAYAKQHNIKFREDSSNASDNYQRNKIRHHITPRLLEINPNLYEKTNQFSSIMRDYQLLVETQIAIIKKKCVSEKNNIITIQFNYIKAHSAKNTILFLLLNEYGFTDNHIEQIFKVEESSKQFFSATHRLIVDRNALIITPIEQENLSHLVLEKVSATILFNQYKIQCTLVPIEKLNIKDNKDYAYIDADKLEFPLVMRFLKDGDYFYPFGIGKPKNPNKVGKKKVAKYFRDQKLSLLEKEQTPILFSKEKAVWLVGHSIDDRFKITESTKIALKFKIIKS